MQESEYPMVSGDNFEGGYRTEVTVDDSFNAVATTTDKASGDDRKYFVQLTPVDKTKDNWELVKQTNQLRMSNILSFMQSLTNLHHKQSINEIKKKA